MTLTAAIYCRISDDRTGQGLGVERQQEDCLALIQRMGWHAGALYIENDRSAYSGKPRPKYRALLADIAAGLVQAVVVWHPDRLHRSPRELEEFIDIAERSKVVVQSVQSGQWDLATATGRQTARIVGAVARGESEHKSERVRRALQQRASKGLGHGRRPYGWTPTGGVKKAEADVVRSLAKRIIAGDSLRSLCADLNARGVLSPSGKPWTTTMLRHIVTRERNVGLLVRHGSVIGEGNWKPILDRATWEQVRAILADPARKTSTSSAAKHLLSGIARCGLCGGPMRAGMNRQTVSYRCADKSCVARRREWVDDLVVQLVVGRLAQPDAVDLLNPARTDESKAAGVELEQLQARLDVAADEYADGKIDARQLDRITARLRPRIETAGARARMVDDSPLLAGLVGPGDVRARWEALPLTRRRAIVDLLVTVKVHRASQGARVFDPESVEVTLR